MSGIVLMWKEGEHTHEFPVPEDREITIGRYQCDITLPQQTISRQHASIIPKSGVYTLHNLSRVNSVVLNGDNNLAHGQKAVIEAGDRFRLGPITIAVSMTSRENLTPKLKCSNCGHVNEYSPEAQCKYCGRNLSAGVTIMVEN